MATVNDIRELREWHDNTRKLMSSAFGRIDANFKQMSNNFSGALEEMNDRLTNAITDVKLQIDDVKADMRGMKADMRDMKADMRQQSFKAQEQQLALVQNSNAASSWSDIQRVYYAERTPLGIVWHDPPPCYPDKLVKFWQLRDLQRRGDLIRLAQHYRIGFENGELLTYVTEHPDAVHARLAEAIGISYQSTSLIMEMRQKEQEMKEQQSRKRPADSQGLAMRTIVNPTTPHETIRIPFEDLIKDPELQSLPSEKPDSGAIRWETSSEAREIREKIRRRHEDRKAALKKADSSSSTSSEGEDSSLSGQSISKQKGPAEP